MPAWCLQVMRRLVAELNGGQGPVGAQLRAFLMERCAGTLLIICIAYCPSGQDVSRKSPTLSVNLRHI